MSFSLQDILVYITVFLALAYLVNKFLLPSSLKLFKKKKKSPCGQDDCGCH